MVASLSLEQPRDRRAWILAAIIAALIHAALLSLSPGWLLHLSAPPKRVEVHTIDPRKLETVRKKWQQQQLLLNKDKSAPKEAEPPKDARYESDRNIRVEKEQRARVTNVLPKSGAQEHAKPETAKPQAVPNLGNLGLPLRLGVKRPATKPPMQAAGTAEGGDQAILDKRLPEGSENVLNAQESIYYSFYARLYEAIAPLWQSRIREVPYKRRVQPGDYSTVVDVVFDHEGNLLEIRQIQSSGIPEFDAAVDSSWHKVARFPNPPRGLLNGDHQVHTGWTFTVQVNAGFGMQYLPPERVY